MRYIVPFNVTWTSASIFFTEIRADVGPRSLDSWQGKNERGVRELIRDPTDRTCDRVKMNGEPESPATLSKRIIMRTTVSISRQCFEN